MEKHEKWIILAVIAIAIYYFFKKGMAQTAPSAITNPNSFLQMLPGGAQTYNPMGSDVNPVQEKNQLLVAQGSAPIPFAPAQPSSPPTITRVGIPTPIPRNNVVVYRAPLRWSLQA
jgi:hypothetical protein